jgi:5-hydroxyisourate hydrolase
MAITTHVLDTSTGRPAAGVVVRLEFCDSGGAWRAAGHGSTDAGGRLGTLIGAGAPLVTGTYRLTFDTGAYFRGRAIEAFHPRVSVEFTVPEATAHYHVPLLISPFGYTTYRGS